jgi:hypothetical protein
MLRKQWKILMKKRTVITTEKHETWVISRGRAETQEEPADEGLQSLIVLSGLLESEEFTAVTDDCFAAATDSHQHENYDHSDLAVRNVIALSNLK